MNRSTHELEIYTHDSLRLRGILTEPRTPRACILLLPGGGAVGANGDVSSPFIGSGDKGKQAPLSEQLSEALAEAGVISLRYDKRGFADPAQLATQTIPNLFSDAWTAFKILKERAGTLPVFVQGLSEGALLAVDIAACEQVAGLFLLSPPTRPYAEALRYQFIGWPVGILRAIDPFGLGYLSKDALHAADVTSFPLSELDPFVKQFGIDLPSLSVSDIPFDDRGRLSFETLSELYETRFKLLSMLLESPVMKPLYESYLALAPFRKLIESVECPAFAYVGMKDAQIAPEWMIEDVRQFKNIRRVALFEGYGHCFAPMAGTLGQIKTSGPISADVTEEIIGDIEALLSR